MLIRCDDSFIPAVVEYIGDDKWKCFYLYADMLESRTEGSDFGLWAIKNGYYDTLHFFSRDPVTVEDMAGLVNNLAPKCIVGTKEIIERLKLYLKGSYRQELSYVFMTEHPMRAKTNYPIKQATEEDVPVIAAAMMEEDIYRRVYTYEDLCRQMQDGIRAKKRRVFMLRLESM